MPPPLSGFVTVAGQWAASFGCPLPGRLPGVGWRGPLVTERHSGTRKGEGTQDLGADWVRENGELIIAGDWIIESGITDVAQLEITAAPGVIRLQRREDGGFQA
ncbi:hypothetical protein ABIE12_000459 [Serratia sp. 509]